MQASLQEFCWCRAELPADIAARNRRLLDALAGDRALRSRPLRKASSKQRLPCAFVFCGMPWLLGGRTLLGGRALLGGPTLASMFD